MSPVGGGGRVEGVLAMQFPITKLNRLMTFDKQWDRSGMGRTGRPSWSFRQPHAVGLFLENPAQLSTTSSTRAPPPDVAGLDPDSAAPPWCSRPGNGRFSWPARTVRHDHHRGLSGSGILQSYAPMTVSTCTG